MTTLQDILDTATAYWAAKGSSSRMMALRAARCASILYHPCNWSTKDATTLTPADATRLLTGLAADGLSKGSQASYYAAFRRALALSGVPTTSWPSGAKPPRRVRDPLSAADVGRLREWLIGQRWERTAHLLDILHGTGCRVEVEALSETAIVVLPHERTIKVTGKGGHERLVPVVGDVYELLRDTTTMASVRGLTYSGHLKRWQKGVTALGISSRLPTPHAVRHLYATKAYEKSGRNLRVVQELLGHADVATTARYIGVNMEELRDAVG